eukprot:CAMPEP_0175943512 /NCGR_PEP_ID=MMETSP0108-20121206/25602_1 /TAXON_ID=195067 ORGANISM="Goniomonas pacifica, Strain CCMP1869" /NCGR_SAMPLE_ID=MMETSP0108 /ASSEMBLY_ACC=CAM_ASM_000204 /LENGTH=98 /DNA_ID=CAMNT_0017268501 /DNA_START=491 /DNA_END=787 /DNA_ORIENTATION=+
MMPVVPSANKAAPSSSEPYGGSESGSTPTPTSTRTCRLISVSRIAMGRSVGTSSLLPIPTLFTFFSLPAPVPVVLRRWDRPFPAPALFNWLLLAHRPD